jgi:hypothetical protein
LRTVISSFQKNIIQPPAVVRLNTQVPVPPDEAADPLAAPSVTDLYTVYRTMALETIIQTRIPADVAEGISAWAAAEGLTISAWLRRFVFREVTRMRVKARFLRLRRPHVPNEMGQAPYPYILERASNMPANQMEFRLLYGPASIDEGRPVTAAAAE